MFNLKNLNQVVHKEKYCAKVSNRFATLKDVNAEVEINSAWKAPWLLVCKLTIPTE
jgi:hypothetical protein